MLSLINFRSTFIDQFWFRDQLLRFALQHSTASFKDQRYKIDKLHNNVTAIAAAKNHRGFLLDETHLSMFEKKHFTAPTGRIKLWNEFLFRNIACKSYYADIKMFFHKCTKVLLILRAFLNFHTASFCRWKKNSSFHLFY